MIDVQSAQPAKLGINGELRFLLLTCCAVIFIFYDLLQMRQGGGIFSAIAAAHDVDSKAAVILIDNDSLLSIFMILLSLLTLLVSRRVTFELHHKGAMALITFGLIFCAFGLNEFLGHRIITYYMSSKVYSRCDALDRDIGKGKGRILFYAYVRDGTHCSLE